MSENQGETHSPSGDSRPAQPQAREEIINKEIATGTFPWLSYAVHSRQSENTPYVVGFYQDEEGKIREIYGQKKFKSKRQVKVDNFLLGGRSEDKEVSLLEGTFQHVSDAEILRSPNWDLLPEDLRQQFEAGKILITSGKDFYNLKIQKGSKHRKVVDEIDPMQLGDYIEEMLDKKVTNYFLLYYSDGYDEGRTGVVMRSEGGEIKPLVVTAVGKEFVVEIKGCGTNIGGFGKMHYRTGHEIITGGAEREQAVNEFYRLQDNPQDDAPKPIGSILFDNNGYKQGYIIRLTPSTVRASYADSESYPPIDKPEYIRRILQMYSTQLVNQIFSETPKILDRSSHTENLLLWGDGRSTFTDFSDHVAFSDRQYPHEESHGGYMTPKQMLTYCIEMVKEIPGYKGSRDQQFFYEALINAFKAKEITLELDITSDANQVVDKIWKGGMAHQVFKARRQDSYLAEGVLEEVSTEMSSPYNQEDLSLESVDAFTQLFIRNRQELVSLMNDLKLVLHDSNQTQLIEQLLTSLNSGDLIRSLDLLDDAWKDIYFPHHKLMPEDKMEALRKQFMYFAGLEGRFIDPVHRYLKHELDVVTSAKSSSPMEDQETLVHAEEEIKERLEHFTFIVNGDIANLYATMMNPSEVRTLVSFNFYGH